MLVTVINKHPKHLKVFSKQFTAGALNAMPKHELSDTNAERLMLLSMPAFKLQFGGCAVGSGTGA